MIKKLVKTTVFSVIAGGIIILAVLLFPTALGGAILLAIVGMVIATEAVAQWIPNASVIDVISRKKFHPAYILPLFFFTLGAIALSGISRANSLAAAIATPICVGFGILFIFILKASKESNNAKHDGL